MFGSPKITAIIPCYNHGEFIREAVDSILAQTFQDFEIIIVNDGSTDPKTVETLKALSLPKTRVLHKENGGSASARNLGIRQARGKYIFTLDADDAIKPEYFEEAVRIFKRRPKVAIVHCQTTFYGPEAGNQGHAPYSPEQMVADNCIHSASLFRKKAWAEVGGFSEKKDFIHVEDHDFWIAILERGYDAYKIEKPLALYRKHENSKSHRLEASSDWMDQLVHMRAQTMRHHPEFYKKHAEFIMGKLTGLAEPQGQPPREEKLRRIRAVTLFREIFKHESFVTRAAYDKNSLAETASQKQ